MLHLRRGKMINRLLQGLCIALFTLPVAVQAETLLPEIPKGKGEKCVEPTDVMRKNHMEFILHQRDETMHNGIRTKKHSLIECINCHVRPDADGTVASYDSPKHFCNSCHTYAAVQIDCFQCHADKPETSQHSDATPGAGTAEQKRLVLNREAQ